MKRYFKAALAAGIIYALLGPVFVHFALDDGLREELTAVLGNVMGKVPAANDAAAGSDWGQFALHVGIRMLLGFLTVAVFAGLQRKRPRFRAARTTGLLLWGLGYIVVPVVLAAKFSMSMTLLFVCIGYGLIETQIAAHVGALSWGKAPAKPH